jgi:signal peptidase
MTHDEEARGDGSSPRPVSGTAADEVTADEGESDDVLTRLRTTDNGALIFVREALVSVSAVVAIGLLLYLVSGVWPPMVAVESGSMEPHLQRGDLVVISAPDRYSPEYAFGDTGVVTVEIAKERGYRTIGWFGSVIIYDPPAREGSPIIHRAHFWVEEGENWYDEANPAYVSADNCAELMNCPAPHAGFITKGDANARYDQASGIAEPVRTEWVEGIARVRVPYLGYIRLKLAGLFLFGSVGDAGFGVDDRSEPLRFVSTPTSVLDERRTVEREIGERGVGDESTATGESLGVGPSAAVS